MRYLILSRIFGPIRLFYLVIGFREMMEVISLKFF